MCAVKEETGQTISGYCCAVATRPEANVVNSSINTVVSVPHTCTYCAIHLVRVHTSHYTNEPSRRMFSQHSLQQQRDVVFSNNDIVHVKTQRSEVLSLFHHLPTSLNIRQERAVSIVTESPS